MLNECEAPEHAILSAMPIARLDDIARLAVFFASE